jgi:hypothetical protein
MRIEITESDVVALVFEGTTIELKVTRNNPRPPVIAVKSVAPERKKAPLAGQGIGGNQRRKSCQWPTAVWRWPGRRINTWPRMGGYPTRRYFNGTPRASQK